MPSIKETYEPRIADHRRILSEHAAIRTLLDPNVPPYLLERFLISFSARGVAMTEPVDGWIRRAGERCIELDEASIGKALITHSKHEAGHHVMLIQDTRALVAHWNLRNETKLSVNELLTLQPSLATEMYIALHENAITSREPWKQVAIELEIERMSTVFGPRLIDQCLRVLGDDIAPGLSFIKEHVALDVGHTRLNERMLECVLEARPKSLDTLVRAGGMALRYYVDFFNECLLEAIDATASQMGAHAVSA
jgi:hypothetical protein